MSVRIQKKLLKLDELFLQLQKIALWDEQISADEQHMLDVVETTIKEYKDYAAEAMDDNVLTVSEQTKLINMQNKLIRKVEATALEDQKITKDEKELLEVIVNTIRTL